MISTIEIRPYELGQVSGFLVVLLYGDTEMLSRPFLCMDDDAREYVEGLFDSHVVDQIVNKALIPGRGVYHDLSDVPFDALRKASREPGSTADVIPLFPDSGGSKR